MIPILYEKSGANFNRNGIGVLADVIDTGTVTQERNGIDELQFQYPIRGQLYSEIIPDRIVKVKPDEVRGLQLYRIDRHTKPINGIVTFYAKHISYDLAKNAVIPFNAGNVNATAALTAILNNATNTHSFTVWSDIATTHNFKISTPASARKCMGGMEGSILDIYGGEFEFDNFTVKLHTARGDDNGVRIAYGKNLTGMKDDYNIQNVYTSICPYCIDENGDAVTLPEKIISRSSESSYGEKRTLVIDLSDKFSEGEQKTVANLRTKANAYLSGSGIDTPSQNIEIDFVPLWQTGEYKSIANLERVKLCDWVTVENVKLGVTVKAKVIKTVYNFVKERYEKIELGNIKSNFAATLGKTIDKATAAADYVVNADSKTKQIVDEQTNIILGGAGGYVYIVKDSNGAIREINFMNTSDPDTAINVLRVNSSGIGFSTTGINGPFTSAWTINGMFNADFIQSGVINGSLIKTGTIQDADGKISINLSNGSVTIVNSTSSRKLYLSNLGALILDSSNNDTIIGGIWAYPAKCDMPTGIFTDLTATNLIASSGSITNLSVGSADISYSNNHLKSNKAYRATGFSVANSNDVEKGAFYLTANDKSYLSANQASVDEITGGTVEATTGFVMNGKTYTPQLVNIDGTPMYILAFTGGSS